MLIRTVDEADTHATHKNAEQHAQVRPADMADESA